MRLNELAIELGSYKISLMSFSDNMGLDEMYFDTSLFMGCTR